MTFLEIRFCSLTFADSNGTYFFLFGYVLDYKDILPKVATVRNKDKFLLCYLICVSKNFFKPSRFIYFFIVFFYGEYNSNNQIYKKMI